MTCFVYTTSPWRRFQLPYTGLSLFGFPRRLIIALTFWINYPDIRDFHHQDHLLSSSSREFPSGCDATPRKRCLNENKHNETQRRERRGRQIDESAIIVFDNVGLHRNKNRRPLIHLHASELNFELVIWIRPKLNTRNELKHFCYFFITTFYKLTFY
jgi:hypothetical protein